MGKVAKADSFGAHLGRRMVQRRAELRLTQGQLAAMVWPGDSEAETKRKGDISKIETGKVANPHPTTVKRIAKALEIADEITEMRRLAQLAPADQLEQLPTLSRADLEQLATHFEIDGVVRMSDDELRDILMDKAKDYRALRDQVAALPDHAPEIARIKANAEQAADNLDFEKVESLLAVADFADTAMAAQTKITRASNALLRNRPEQAFEILSAAADGFRSADPSAPSQVRAQIWEPLYDHGLRYGGAGLELAERMLREAREGLGKAGIGDLLAQTTGNLATVLITHSSRLAGDAGTMKLSEATKALRDLLPVFEGGDPMKWAGTQQNLGNALQTQGSRTAGPGGAALLAEAVAAYRAALRVSTESDHPVQWATTQQNLGNALRTQGTRTAGPGGAALLGDAVAAYRAALTVTTESDHPLDWAMTQQNLGAALQTQGSRTAGPEGAGLLAKAVATYRAALRVRTETDHPVDWATTQQNLGGALATQGERTAGPEGAALLEDAVATYRAALRVFTETDHGVHWAMTRENLALAESAIADHDSTTEPRPHLEAALAHVEAALTVYDPEHMAYDYGTASRLRDDLRARLAVLDG